MDKIHGMACKIHAFIKPDLGIISIIIIFLVAFSIPVLSQVVLPETPLTISNALITHTNCYGGNEGAIDLTVCGGSTPYGFQWSTGEITEDISSLVADEYTVTITDANSCEIVGSWMIQAVCDPVCYGQPIYLYCVVPGCGMPGATYLWTNSSGTWTSADTDPVILPGTLGYASDTFSVYVQYDPPVGSFSTGSCIITVNDPITFNNVLVTHTNCYAGNEGAIDLTTTGGSAPYGFLWSTGEITEDINSLVAGEYTVTVTDANNCTLVGNWMVQAACDPVCYGQPINLYCVVPGCGIPGATYLWTNSSGTWTSAETDPVIQPGSVGYASDTFSVYVQYDPPLGSFSTGSCIITVNDPITFSNAQVTHTNCYAGNEGAIALTAGGGTAPYGFLWSTGETTEDINSLVAGEYTVTVTDANNCTLVGSWMVQAVCDPVCYGQSINLYCVVPGCGMPGASYLWTNSSGTWTSTETDPVIFPGTLGYASDTFSVLVQYDPPAGSFSTGSCVIMVRDSIAITWTLQDVQCRGGNDGGIDLEVSGGVSPYSCIWSNGMTTQHIDSLVAGDYSVTLTDQNFCTATKIFSLSQPSTNCDLVVGGQMVDNGFNECFDAKQTLTIGGGGSLFLIENGGSATMIAGQIITYLPGTRVNHGGYMHGYITTDDQYCNNEKSSLVTKTRMDDPPVKNQQELQEDKPFNVYPNPTTGLVTLDMAKTMGPGPVRVEIYSMQCEKVFSQQLMSMQKHSLSLYDLPPGVYLLRVLSEGVVTSVKIVKQ